MSFPRVEAQINPVHAAISLIFNYGNQTAFANLYNLTQQAKSIGASLGAKLNQIPPLLPPFITLADNNPAVLKHLRPIYDTVLYSARVLIETNVNSTYSLGDLSFNFFTQFVITNYTIFVGAFSPSVTDIALTLSNAFSTKNPKAVFCSYINAIPIFTLINDYFMGVGACSFNIVDTSFSGIIGNIDNARTVILAKYNEFARCTAGITANSTTTAINSAKLCAAIAMNGIPYSAMKASDLIASAGVLTWEILILQQSQLYYSCLDSVNSMFIPRAVAMKTAIQTCLK
jgi:hypothetical protein